MLTHLALTHTAAASTHVEAAGFVLSGIEGILVLIGGVIAAVVCALVAEAKGCSALLFAVLGFSSSITTLIVVLVIPRRTRVRAAPSVPVRARPSWRRRTRPGRVATGVGQPTCFLGFLPRGSGRRERCRAVDRTAAA